MVAACCRYYVDGDVAVNVSGEWVMADDAAAPSTPAEGVAEHNTREKPKKYPGEHDVATWSHGAVVVVPCEHPGRPGALPYDRMLLDISAHGTPLNDEPHRAHEVFGLLAQHAASRLADKLDCEQQGKQGSGRK
ncbi:hypothetical protein SCA03_26910 [Streptomyces cacaoi]|uniref:Uncharacterized protein n=2 Tax=Streptomyces cacaoi TaxID=1898 RepID=A0A4Y3R288_STRCI|nr:hypothetical protein SCA03_26910 [Streptomyces cacaoi]